MRLRVVPMILSLSLAGCGKSNIEPSCTMNGLGEGECSFTNMGSAAGASCGKITVTRTNGMTTQSSTFCSGEVAKQSTTKVAFKIPAVHDLCSTTPGTSWKDACSFTFEKDGDAAKNSAAASEPPSTPASSGTPPSDPLFARANAATAKLNAKLEAGTATQADLDEATAIAKEIAARIDAGGGTTAPALPAETRATPVRGPVVPKASALPPNIDRLRSCCVQLRAGAKAMGASPEAGQLLAAATQCDVLAARAGGDGHVPETGSLTQTLAGRNLPPACAGF